jgi:4'-phosphopantetheinyl transferase
MIDGVHIWRAALDDPGWPGPEALPARERERAAEFLRPQPARRWVAARWALRRVLGQYLDLPAEAIELEAGEHGKPRLGDRAGPEFNLSHSEGLALVAVAEREVGVDVEAIRPGRDLLALAERTLEPDDCDAIRGAAPLRRPAVFYAAWARHEARLKCLGTGLGAPDPSAEVAIETIEVGPRFAAAVAVAGSEVGPLDCRTLHAG